MKKVRILFIEDDRTDITYELTKIPSTKFFAELIHQMFCFFG